MHAQVPIDAPEQAVIIVGLVEVIDDVLLLHDRSPANCVDADEASRQQPHAQREDNWEKENEQLIR